MSQGASPGRETKIVCGVESIHYRPTKLITLVAIQHVDTLCACARKLMPFNLGTILVHWDRLGAW